jgi:hypothetical protein
MTSADQLRKRSNPTEAELSTLPTWAQAHIRGLKNQAASLKDRVAELSDGPADSRVRAHNYTGPDVKLGNPRMDFFLGESRERWEDMVECTVEDGRLRIQTHGAGRNMGVLAPVNGAVTEVFFVERDR